MIQIIGCMFVKVEPGVDVQMVLEMVVVVQNVFILYGMLQLVAAAMAEVWPTAVL